MIRIRERLRSLIDFVDLKRGEGFSHLVLTVRSQDDVKKMCKFLVASFRKLRNRKPFKAHVCGGAYVLEITHSAEGWHAHLHIILQNTYISQTWLLSSWRSIVGSGGVFIKRIPKLAIINYLTKYMCKSELPESLRDECGDILRRQRLFTVFGIWHKLLPGWTKIPYKCHACGSTVWTPLLHPDPQEYITTQEILRDKYG